MDEKIEKKLLYLIKYSMYFTDNLINSVLEDSEEDPHYSAVTATNLIKCYIAVMEYLKYELPYSNIEEYFKADPFLKDSFELFELKRQKEIEHYHGEIY